MNEKRTPEQYSKLGRAFWQNHLRAEAAKRETGKLRFPNAFYRPRDFLEKHVWNWVKHYFKSRFGSKYPFRSYPCGSAGNGIYKIDNNSTIAMAADWAADTDDADRVAELMNGGQHDYTIHLGDIYFVGSYDEVRRNFTDPDASWRIGKKGSFALSGNHEMYARGKPYFVELLDKLGIKEEGKNTCAGQHASYFCLETDHWRIIGIDTAYNSIGRIPFLEHLSWFKPDCSLEDEMMNWLKRYVKLGNPDDKRGIIFLSHHQYITAFDKEDEYQRPAEQLAGILGNDRPVIWIWGHEHRFSIYGMAKTGKGIAAYGRCIGNGGLPIELKAGLNKKKKGYSNLVVYDSRVRTVIDNEKVGYNGYSIMKLNGDVLVIDYYDTESRLVSEKWKTTGDGALTGEIELLNPNLSLAPGRKPEDAVPQAPR